MTTANDKETIIARFIYCVALWAHYVTITSREKTIVKVLREIMW
jgi:hypothetical protein